jgi:primosomal protein N' (replication factor Y)
LHSKYESNQGLELLETLKNASKQKNCFNVLSINRRKETSTEKLVEAANSTSAIVKSINEKEIFEDHYIQEDRTL